MDARINMIMVSAKDVPALRRFYEDGLGWTPWMPATSLSIMYQVGTSILVFLDADYQEKQSGIPAVATPKGLWAIFMKTKEEVAAVFDRAIAAGATVTSPIRDRDGGLWSGYFTDPEGNGWEVVWSPDMTPTDDGGLTLTQA
jgi:predicted lactoylglutathione lyase